ncbi:MAG: hypothetical protein RSO15_09815 [Bacteroides sp.]|uniref:hypothetical protein n=1 Tax=Bacteroides sp. TaxID=29523 RepID=UPI002FC70CBF
MNVSKIKKYNSQSFLYDLEKVKSVMVHAAQTNSYYYITKKDLLRDAESNHIEYFIGKDIGYPSELSMIVL